MTRLAPPILDPLTVDSCVADTRARIPAFVPGWDPGPAGPGAALMQVYARFLKSLADRLNQAPDKNKLAFFDRLGVDLLPAQAARAPVVFKPVRGMPDATVPARTRVGATAVDGAQLVFETDESIALASASLVQVVSLWPGRDAWRDHSSELVARASFRLFENLEPVPHALYLAHDTVLALAGPSMVEVELELGESAPTPLPLVWEYWDGEIWRGFQEFLPLERAGATDPVDLTRGLTRTGIVRLVTACGSSFRTVVNGVEARWIRARLATPLAPAPNAALAALDRIRLSSVVDRSLPASAWLAGRGIVPEQAFGGEVKLDLTRTITPLGARPEAGSALYLACDEALTKPGAVVTLRYRRIKTPEEIADQQGAAFTANVEQAQQAVVNAVKKAIDAMIRIAGGLLDIGVNPPTAALTPQINIAIGVLNDLRVQLVPERMDLIATIRQAAQNLLGLLFGVPAGTQANFGWADVGAALLAAAGIPGPLATALFDFKDLNDQRIAAAATDVRAAAQDIIDALNFLKVLTPETAALAGGAQLPTMADPVVAWEYWNGRRWLAVGASAPGSAGSLNFTEFAAGGAEVTFSVPDDVEPVEYSGVTARWIRARLVSGGYGIVTLVTWKDEQTGHINFFPAVQVRPPNVELLRLGYVYRSRLTPPEHAVTENDFSFIDRTKAARTRGEPFAPFTPVEDRTPALYLGFDAPLPADQLSLYLDIEEVVGDEEGPELEWEAWDGETWAPVRERDATRRLTVPGMVTLPWPGTRPDMNALRARFGTARAWLRARRRTDGTPRNALIRGIHLNAAWASEVRTYDGETLGAGNGEPGQSFRLRNAPVMAGEVVEVRELSGPRARVEEPILREELLRAGLSETDIRVVRDPRSNATTEVWVRWRNSGSLQFGGPGDRIYEVERTRGRVRFGGLATGRTVPAGADNIRMAGYRAGGGTRGNVGTDAIARVLAGVLAERVRNPVPAEGGADSEPPERMLERGGTVIRNRRQAITASDYEELAREASPAVAVARAIATEHPGGRRAAGWVTVRIVPRSSDPRPWPSFELREQVRQFISRRAPAQLTARIAVIPALYFPVGVEAVVSPKDPGLSGAVVSAVRAELARFLHPLSGGPEGRGWPFGRDVYASDLCAALEGLEGLDYVSSLALLVGGSPVGDHIRVPDDRMVVAADLTVRLHGSDD